MANFDFRMVGYCPKKSEETKLTFEEFDEQLEALNKRHEELMALPNNEWVSKEVQDELRTIHEKYLKLAKAILKA